MVTVLFTSSTASASDSAAEMRRADRAERAALKEGLGFDNWERVAKGVTGVAELAGGMAAIAMGVPMTFSPLFFAGPPLAGAGLVLGLHGLANVMESVTNVGMTHRFGTENTSFYTGGIPGDPVGFTVHLLRTYQAFGEWAVEGAQRGLNIDRGASSTGGVSRGSVPSARPAAGAGMLRE